MTTESRYAVPLATMNLRQAVVQASSSGIRFGLTKETEGVRRYLEKGREKGAGRDREQDIGIALRDEDQMPDRVASALVHLGRLCGAEVRIEY